MVFVCLFVSLSFVLGELTPFSISCSAGLVVENSLNFCMSGKVLISPSHLKESLAGYIILGW